MKTGSRKRGGRHFYVPQSQTAASQVRSALRAEQGVPFDTPPRHLYKTVQNAAHMVNLRRFKSSRLVTDSGEAPVASRSSEPGAVYEDRLPSSCRTVPNH